MVQNFLVQWFEMDFRGDFDYFLNKFSEPNVEKNKRKASEKALKHEQKSRTATPHNVGCQHGFCKLRFRNILGNCFEFFVQWFEMDFRGDFDYFLNKFSELNVEKNKRKRQKRLPKHEQRTYIKIFSVKIKNSFLVTLRKPARSRNQVRRRQRRAIGKRFLLSALFVVESA